MKSKTKSSPEYTNFRDALGKVLKVSHDEIKERIEKEKKPESNRTSSSGPASGDKD